MVANGTLSSLTSRVIGTNDPERQCCIRKLYASLFICRSCMFPRIYLHNTQSELQPSSVSRPAPLSNTIS